MGQRSSDLSATESKLSPEADIKEDSALAIPTQNQAILEEESQEPAVFRDNVLANTSPRPSSTSNHSARLSKSVASKDINVQPTLRPLAARIQKYLTLQDLVSTLRVRLQQLREGAANERKNVAEHEEKIEETLNHSEITGELLDASAFREMLEAVNSARDALKASEKQVADLEFRLVSEEYRLVTRGQRLRASLLESQAPESENNASRTSSLPTSPSKSHAGARAERASTDISFEEDSEPLARRVIDPDVPQDADNVVKRTIVESYDSHSRAESPVLHDRATQQKSTASSTSDLLEAGHMTQGALSEDADPIEQYVEGLEKLTGSYANGEEHLEFVMTTQLPEKLFSLQHCLEKAFVAYDLELREWFLHIHNLRKTVHEMLVFRLIESVELEKAMVLVEMLHMRESEAVDPEEHLKAGGGYPL